MEEMHYFIVDNYLDHPIAVPTEEGCAGDSLLQRVLNRFQCGITLSEGDVLAKS